VILELRRRDFDSELLEGELNWLLDTRRGSQDRVSKLFLLFLLARKNEAYARLLFFSRNATLIRLSPPPDTFMTNCRSTGYMTDRSHSPSGCSFIAPLLRD